MEANMDDIFDALECLNECNQLMIKETKLAIEKGIHPELFTCSLLSNCILQLITVKGEKEAKRLTDHCFQTAKLRAKNG